MLPWIRAYSPIELVSNDDPSVYLDHPRERKAPVLGEPQPDPMHSAIYGLKLRERIRPLGVECVVAYPAAPDARYGSIAKSSSPNCR